MRITRHILLLIIGLALGILVASGLENYKPTNDLFKLAVLYVGILTCFGGLGFIASCAVND